MIISPLNYAGNKAKLLKEILQLFPENIDIFVDAFAGSGIVSFNSNSKKIICNDINKNVVELVKYLYETNSEKIIKKMNYIIKKYGFTDSTNKKNNYVQYRNEGLSKYNKGPFELLKKDYNKKNKIEYLFALIIFGFNHYMRYNKKGEYNVPVGKVDFSSSLREKTKKFSEAMKQHDATFVVGSYLNENLYKNLTKNSFVYFDPPYLITTAPYNVDWNLEDDKKLFSLFDKLNERGIRVAMSNVFISNGKKNSDLIFWSKKYNVHYLKRQYRNANYQKKNVTDSIEVLITNY